MRPGPAGPAAYLASEHEGQGPVAADELTLTHDRREALEVPDGQRHQTGAAAARPLENRAARVQRAG